jgi:hypothetical protein
MAAKSKMTEKFKMADIFHFAPNHSILTRNCFLKTSCNCLPMKMIEKIILNMAKIFKMVAFKSGPVLE